MTPLPSPLDRFLPEADVRERHETTVRAPAGVVMEAARSLSFRSIPIVRAIFWLRGRILGARPDRPEWSRAFVEEALAAGWGVLYEDAGRCFVAGSSCRPWVPDVVFTPIAPDRFLTYNEPGRVKIAWMLQVEPLAGGNTRFITETRAAATDAQARETFRRYWRHFGAGVVLIRWLLLPAVRRDAERRHRSRGSSAPAIHPR